MSDAPAIPAVVDITELPVDTEAELKSAVTSGDNRSPGLHLSSILKAIDKALHGQTKQEGAFNLGLCAFIGFLWERVFALCFGDMMGVERPGEKSKDGITCSPDGIGPDPWGLAECAVYEQKCWWRSTKKTPMLDWYVMAQNQAYCHVVGTTVGVFDVLYLVGNSWAFGPVWKRWRVQYDEDGLAMHWEMIVRNKNMGKEE